MPKRAKVARRAKTRKPEAPVAAPAAVEEKDVGGRPTKYDPERHPTLAYKLALLGATDAQVADALEVAVVTINVWNKEHEEFRTKLAAGKLVADAEIAHSLYHRGKGCKHPDVAVTNYKGEVTLTPLEKHYPPDTAAASLWLRNRQPDKWRDKVDLEHGGKVGHEHSGEVAVKLSPEEAYLKMLGGKK